MRHAGAVLEAVLLAAALCGIQRLVHRKDDGRDVDVLAGTGQRITTPRAPGAFDQLMAAQLAEELFEIGQGNLLPLTDARQRDRPIVLAQGQVDHGGHGKAALGGQPHDNTPMSGIRVRSIPDYPS